MVCKNGERTGSRERLFIATAIIECGAGVSLVSVPASVTWLLLDVRVSSPETLIMSRVGGAGLLAIGVACWFARHDRGSRSQHGLLWGAFIYNLGACAVLAFAGSMQMVGFVLWPGVILHAVMALWCAANLRASAVNN